MTTVEQNQSSGVMHCWLMAKINVAGDTYIALRGVNWHGEYDASRVHAPVGVPWWHVPTSKFKFDVDGELPSIEETKKSVLPIACKEWPFLAHGRIVSVDQELTGEWGRFNADGKSEPVTRIAFDCGEISRFEDLPDPTHRLGENLHYWRHPVAWVKASEVAKLPKGMLTKQGEQVSPYSIGLIQTPMETEQGLKLATAENLLLQESVGSMFEKSFGEIFSPAANVPQKNIISPPTIAIANYTPAT